MACCWVTFIIIIIIIIIIAFHLARKRREFFRLLFRQFQCLSYTDAQNKIL